jgi:RHH-type proline utilization regulon transcriptional repressor/proline dehydrogenase/delta 1-pyrroline-5-carboxylate dehydrogenase
MGFFSRFRRRATDATLPPLDDPALNARIEALGAELLAEARGHQKGLLSASFWSDKLMDWAMKDPAFKVQLFRFVDCFPTLKTPQAVHAHFMDYMAQPGVKPPPGLTTGLKAGGLFKGTFAKTLSGRIEAMAQRFIAGEDATSAADRLRALWDGGTAFSVDLLGEACVSTAEADAYQARYLDIISNLADIVRDWPENPVLERDHLGAIPRANVSVKISAFAAQTDPVDTEGVIENLMVRLVPLLEKAAQAGVFVNFDMEHYGLKDLTLQLFERCCQAVPFEAGLAVQAYLRSGDADAAEIVAMAQRIGRPITVRLVKGAYWDHETIHAEEMGWPVPVWSRKADTDACFERMTRTFLQATPKAADAPGVKLALGSHNLRSIATALALMEAAELPPEALELQMLQGMADPLKAVAKARGMRLREYVPVGEMIPGMAYLVRRLLENTSNESWLRGGFNDAADPATLLASPHAEIEGPDPGVARIEEGPERHALSVAVPAVGDGRPFFTEALRDFAQAEVRRAFQTAVDAVRVASVANDGTLETMEAMVARAHAARDDWRKTPAKARAALLVKAAAIMRAQRDALAAEIILEAGKGWHGADADVCEAIDFCEYYAREGAALFEPPRLGQFIGEANHLHHRPRGVCAVIAPWNFPLAIACGMTVAALVTGNPVILKPAEQTPAIAKRLCDILWQAGVPKDVLHCLPAPGETVGAALVRHPKVALIAFTGSKAVGLDIIRAAAETGQRGFVKQVICEMGGKNAIIVDASADLDEAVVGVRASAFGFQGQKCSACSRVIVHTDAHDAFVERLVEATRSLAIGDPRRPGTDVGPVIDAAAARGIEAQIEAARKACVEALSMSAPSGLAQQVGKPFVGPHIFTAVQPDHRIFREEIFGPVLAVIRADDFEHALALANESDYRLTGAVYSRRPAHLALAREEFAVGNLYLNRGSTGALVGRQPFGGFGLSGVGEKAGGAAYLRQFVVSRLVCENTQRRGFAPGL